jgi:hypothetical protein
MIRLGLPVQMPHLSPSGDLMNKVGHKVVVGDHIGCKVRKKAVGIRGLPVGFRLAEQPKPGLPVVGVVFSGFGSFAHKEVRSKASIDKLHGKDWMIAAIAGRIEVPSCRIRHAIAVCMAGPQAKASSTRTPKKTTRKPRIFRTIC